ncbi:MAG: KH domain-containing protein [Holophagaceae bacterium]|nr:KH domain-containing protein [Holophagaceae bacterium]
MYSDELVIGCPWETELDLEAFLRDVLTPVLDVPEELSVEINKNGRQVDVFLRACQKDRGRIIGRNGRMISSLRTLCRTAGEKQGLHINLELLEDDTYETDASSMET